ncbi:MAG TPA: AAA family ATPase, partial [Polyangiales bacterium]
YALGVMLFEALTGDLPFAGRPGEVLAAKQRDAAPRVREAAHSVPADLEHLCDRLLASDPALRPDVAAIQAALGGTREGSLPPDARAPVGRLIGRERELQVLRDAYGQTLHGEPVVVLVEGESGIGKSSLCEEFLSELRAAGSAVVLSGRCREQETVPFKAFDAIIDELSRYLRRLPTDRAAALLPRDVFALCKLFPVLARVDVVAEVPAANEPSVQELRRRAFSALGETFARIRDRQPLVVCIDDLQWTDLDSAAMLRHLLVTRNPLAGMLVLVHRTENVERDLLADVLDAAASNVDLHLSKLSLGPLSLSDTEQVARRLLDEAGEADPALSHGIARESAGSPFLAAELARLAQSGAQAPREAPSLATALLTRVGVLSEGAQRALELLALVGRPMAVDLLLEASPCAPSDLDSLRSANLVRGREQGGRRSLECYHDRIREVVATALPEGRRMRCYHVLAELLIARDGASPELLSTCLEQVGDHGRAAQYAALAAEQAAAAMAFDRAATLYGRSLQLASLDPATRCVRLIKLGTALEHAGRGREAASAYRHAAALSLGDEAVELRRRAAEQMLTTGHLEEGLALLRSVCRELHYDVSWGERAALLNYAWNRVRLQFHALDTEPQQSAASSARDRLRMRVARTLVTGLIGYLPVQTASNASRYMLMALERGERVDRIRALGFHAYIQTLIDPGGRQASVLLERIDQLASESASPELVGFSDLMKGTASYHGGRYAMAREHLARALRSLRTCSGVDWEIDCANIYDQLSASDAGAYADIARSTPSLIDEAFRRGRVWAAAMLSGFGVHAWLVPDDPSGYSIVLAEAKQQWRGTDKPRWPDFVLLAGESQQLMYMGAAREAFALFEREYHRYVSSGIMRSSGKGIGGFSAHHGKAAAAALRMSGRDGRGAARMRVVLREAVQSLRGQGGDKRLGIAGTLEAALLVDRAEASKAHAALVAAADVLEVAGADMLAAAARRRAGQLLPGTRGRALIARGEAFMQAQGVRNLEALTEVSCPGCVAS